eukprot:scaffold1869_cov493-Prasinococcus_capsulatus_cf.AAC.5
MGMYDCRPTTVQSVRVIPADYPEAGPEAWEVVACSKLWASAKYLSRVERNLSAHYELLCSGMFAWVLYEVVKGSPGRDLAIRSLTDADALWKLLLGSDGSHQRNAPWVEDDLPFLPWLTAALEDEPHRIPKKQEIYEWVTGADTMLPAGFAGEGLGWTRK